ncbi:T9SS type B sorting domain-containing protein [Flavobacterium paronense]|uniref:T9SS type B sorting domain-containing protein n=1 Tax=Flavobacterium paronense TaxID=1392775 RepID=A0ABV5GB04_9FLAO|nr:T9SS type B sorting domain-containing protein [Flavobacterium paronense]MDN3676804.1 T9SS type B sorting domain-containing protein [Flavobacterium paronense]
MKKKLFYLLFVLLFSLNCFSQFSKTHYIPPLSGSSSVTSEDQFLYISTPNVNPVNFRIIELGGNTILGTVSRDAPYVYDVGFGNDTQLHVDQSLASGVLNNKGYIVEADDLVYVSARVTAGSGNQAGELVSKGIASLGLRFRVGAFTNTLVNSYVDIHYTFVSVLATENNTTVTFSGMKTGVQLVNNANGSSPYSIVLNRGESYVMAVQGPTEENRDGLIGTLVLADKPIAVNCGSFGGSNAVANLDLGFDQIVPAERLTTNDYIFIKSTGIDTVEKILLVADEDTQITLNGSGPIYNILAGEYLALTGADYTINGNLYVSSTHKIFAYQSVGDDGATDQRNQELFFVPPLSCQTPRVIDNIPLIDFIGTRQFTGRVTIVTTTSATLNFIIDGANYTLASLASIGVTVGGPFSVTGNANYETYVLTGVTGNVSVFSSGELYLAAYGSEQAATFGGYYSGFTFKPEISFNEVDVTQLGCIPNSVLSVNSLSPFDVFQWYFNGGLIPGATNNTYQPKETTASPPGLGPGYYYVSATIAGCTSPKDSDNIPVSSCPNDNDNDSVIDNVDLDNDNDGIPNCAESYGNQVFNFFNTASGSISINTYSNSYIGAISFTGTGTPSITPVFGDAGGNFVTEAAQGKNNSVSYTLSNFTSPISLSVSYADIAAANNLFTSSTEIRITCPVDKTLTILNPTNQLLIDTNYDGIFESGITQYSSFEIRFRLNSSVSLPIGTGTFFIVGNLINSITITNINLSDSSTSRVALNLFATCIPKDSDGDGIADQNDLDSDNDSILDLYEAQGPSFLPLSTIDLNQDGIDDVFGAGIYPPDVPNADVDLDEVPNYLDLDSDNDGIHDIDEAGFTITDADNNGVIDGVNFGANGLFNPLETAADSGILKPIYILADTDADGIYNAIELDSDNDLCNDVIEAGYLDSNLDGLLGGTTPPTINPNGLVTSGIGYGNPNPNYITAAPIVINTQPQNRTACELQSVTFTINTNVVNTYQWQLSTDNGVTWSIISNNATYAGAGTNALTVSNVTPTMVGYQYRCFLNKTGNTCGLYSSAATLTTYPLPVVTTLISLKQCDDDTDGISTFNLTQKNDVISANYLLETFTYYTSLAAANIQNNTFLIANPNAYTSGSASVYARVENSNGCFRVARIDLLVSVTQIPASFVIPNQYLCDDYLDAVNNDRDGISGPFNFTSITNSLLAFLPSPSTNYSIKYYKTEADFFAETDASGNSLAITNTANYRNIGFPNLQTIWVRVESTLDNSCYGYKTFNVVVEALPTANPINAANLIRHCDDNQDGIYGFDTSTIQSTVLNGQTGVNVKYSKANGSQLSTPLPNPFFVNSSETITIKVANNSTQTGGQPCYDEETLQFIVDDLPEAFAIASNLTSICDEEVNPINQNGLHNFDTSTFQSTIIGSQTGVNTYYFDQNNNPLPSPLPNPFTTATQNIKVIVENPINTTCTAQLIIPFVVHPTPKIDLEENIIICLPETQAIIDAGILDGTPTADYQFHWYTNNVLNGLTSPTLTVNSPGIYSVDVTNAFGCTKTRVITVTGSEIATIQSIDVVDLAEINTITVNVSPTSLGDYEFAIDDVNGPYRDNNFFDNVPMGLHDIYVRDKNGCGSVGPITVAVLGIPHYFTPNGDGYNDYWNVKGVSAQFNYRSTIYIFDRFGKLLKQIGTTGLGWDGTFNGRPMPADDYWYNIKFEDGRNVKGHFALKR